MHRTISVIASIVFALALLVGVTATLWRGAFLLSIGMLSFSAALFGVACYMKLEEMDEGKKK